jgi:hypothetical protein
MSDWSGVNWINSLIVEVHSWVTVQKTHLTQPTKTKSLEANKKLELN